VVGGADDGAKLTRIHGNRPDMATRVTPRAEERMDVRRTRFDIAGVLTLGLDDADAVTRRLVVTELDPFPPLPTGAEADLVLECAADGWRPALVDIHGLAADGSISASDGRSMYVVVDDRVASFPDPWRDDKLRFVYQPGFPVVRIFSSLIRPTIQMGMLLRQAATVHATSVEIDGSAILVAGWSESGKTETALALMEREARFLSDKWTVVSADGWAAPFPISVGVRRWVLPYLPTLRGAMPRRSSARFLASGAARAAITPILRSRGHGRIAGLAGQAARQGLALADRVALTTTELRNIYGQRDDATRRIPVRMVVLLTTVPAGTRPRIQKADRGWVIERLARAAAFERRAFYAWQERAAFAFPSRSTDPSIWIDRERRLLDEAVGSAELVNVEVPFPTDPRPVADMIRECLH
jgi:hypothetical protein